MSPIPSSLRIVPLHPIYLKAARTGHPGLADNLSKLPQELLTEAVLIESRDGW